MGINAKPQNVYHEQERRIGARNPASPRLRRSMYCLMSREKVPDLWIAIPEMAGTMPWLHR